MGGTEHSFRGESDQVRRPSVFESGSDGTRANRDGIFLDVERERRLGAFAEREYSRSGGVDSKLVSEQKQAETERILEQKEAKEAKTKGLRSKERPGRFSRSD